MHDNVLLSGLKTQTHLGGTECVLYWAGWAIIYWQIYSRENVHFYILQNRNFQIHRIVIRLLRALWIWHQLLVDNTGLSWELCGPHTALAGARTWEEGADCDHRSPFGPVLSTRWTCQETLHLSPGKAENTFEMPHWISYGDQISSVFLGHS